MQHEELEKLRYPIGRFQRPGPLPMSHLQLYIKEIDVLPGHLKESVSGLSARQLDTPYRPEGWTIRQVVHHLPDSHMNSYIRFKWALTENNPTIKAYEEQLWAELPEARSAPVEISLLLLESLHRRWVIMLHAMQEKEFTKTYIHPENAREYRLDEVVALYAWHGKHHLAQIEALRERENW